MREARQREVAFVRASHAEQLPAVQWKLQNIAQMTPQKRSLAIARLQAVLKGHRF